MSNIKTFPPMTRCLDPLGSLSIPQELLHFLGWEPGHKLDIAVLDPLERSLSISPASRRCSLCHMVKKNLQLVRKGFICKDCVNYLYLASGFDDTLKGLIIPGFPL